MARRFKLPKKINGFRLPKPLRKQANAVIARLQGEDLEALLGALIAVGLSHYAAPRKDGAPSLTRKLAGALGSHLGS